MTSTYKPNINQPFNFRERFCSILGEICSQGLELHFLFLQEFILLTAVMYLLTQHGHKKWYGMVQIVSEFATSMVTVMRGIAISAIASESARHSLEENCLIKKITPVVTLSSFCALKSALKMKRVGTRKARGTWSQILRMMSKQLRNTHCSMEMTILSWAQTVTWMMDNPFHWFLYWSFTNHLVAYVPISNELFNVSNRIWTNWCPSEISDRDVCRP